MRILSENEVNVAMQDKYALVDFYADWCGPCKYVAPELEKASAKINELGVNVYKVNVDDCNDFSMKNKISYIPTLILFADGTEKDRFVGVKDADGILEFVKKNV